MGRESAPEPSVIRITKSWVACRKTPPQPVAFGASELEAEQLVRVTNNHALHNNRFVRPLDPTASWEIELLRQQAYYMPYALAVYGKLLYGFSNGPQSLFHPLCTGGCAEQATCHGVLGNGEQLGPSTRRALHAMIIARRHRRNSGEYLPPLHDGSAPTSPSSTAPVDSTQISLRQRGLGQGAKSNTTTSDVAAPITGEEADDLIKSDGGSFSKYNDCCLCDSVAQTITTGSNPGTVLYANYSGTVTMRPFLVQVDESTQTIVVAVRGTLSAEDVLVDADAEPLDIRGEPEVLALTRPSSVHVHGETASTISGAGSSSQQRGGGGGGGASAPTAG